MYFQRNNGFSLILRSKKARLYKKHISVKPRFFDYSRGLAVLIILLVLTVILILAVILLVVLIVVALILIILTVVLVLLILVIERHYTLPFLFEPLLLFHKSTFFIRLPVSIIFYVFLFYLMP